MPFDVGFGQPLEEKVCLQCTLSTRWWICENGLRPSIHVAGNPPPPQKVAIEFYYTGASIKRLG